MILDEQERESLRASVRRLGVVSAAAEAGVSRQTLITALAGLEVRSGSALALRVYLMRAGAAAEAAGQ